MQVLSDILHINKPYNLSAKIIEDELIKHYGSILRWAIVGVCDKDLKICVTYEKGV